MMKVFNVNGELIEEAKDVLYEIGNVGTATAVVPVANIKSMEFRISIPQVFKADDNIFASLEYPPNQVVIGVNTKMNKAFDGSILFLLSLEFVHNTVELMLEETISNEELLVNEDSVSAIQEIINYMTAGYVKVMGNYLDIPMFISSAQIGIEPVRDIIRKTLEEITPKHQSAACVNTTFSVIDKKGNVTDENGQIIIFPGEESIAKLMHVFEEE